MKNEYTAEQVEALVSGIRWRAITVSEKADILTLLTDYAATMRQQAERGGGEVSSEVVSKAWDVYLSCAEVGDQGMRAAIEAIAPLLRAPAEQGEAVQLPPDWRREGMVVVVDSATGKLLGCMGRAAWDAQAGAEKGGRVDSGLVSELLAEANRQANETADLLNRAAEALAQNAQDQHPDDAAVDRFAAALKTKLAEARAKGRGGWGDDEPGMQQRLSDMLRDHVAKGDPRDVGNFAMFLHQRGESILPAHSEQGDARAEEYAERLARSLWREHYAEDAPQWEPLTGDLMGLLSQIDNMTTGLTHAEPQNAQGEAVAELDYTSNPPHINWFLPMKASTYKLYLHAERARVPDGWVLVPREPTPEMIDACIAAWQQRLRRKAQDGTLLCGGNAEKSFRENWTAMLNATPDRSIECTVAVAWQHRHTGYPDEWKECTREEFDYTKKQPDCPREGRALYAHAERVRVPQPIIELDECRKVGWNDSAPAYRAGWNACRDAMLAAAPSQPEDAA